MSETRYHAIPLTRPTPGPRYRGRPLQNTLRRSVNQEHLRTNQQTPPRTPRLYHHLCRSSVRRSCRSHRPTEVLLRYGLPLLEDQSPRFSWDLVKRRHREWSSHGILPRQIEEGASPRQLRRADDVVVCVRTTHHPRTLSASIPLNYPGSSISSQRHTIAC